MNIFLRFLGITTAFMLVVAAGCSTPSVKGFAIYLTRDDIPPAQMVIMSHVELADQPVIGVDDIISYNAQTHEIKLTDSAFERIAKLEVPVQGKSFMVCVDRGPIYAGAFWTPLSSMSYDGITIWKPLGSQATRIVTLELGYPSAAFYGYEDPRNDPEILSSLDRAGKLVEKLSIDAISQLPRSMKGYELYSWQQEGQWHYTLITGTNRNKTSAEIVSTADYVSESGWVQIQVSGVEAIKNALAKLPPNEQVIWLNGLRAEQPASGAIDFSLPPPATIDSIRDFALAHGLDLTVAQ